MSDELVSEDARHPPRSRPSASCAPPRRTCARRPRSSASAARRSSARSSTSRRSAGTIGNAGQANYSAGKAGDRRPDQDAGQGVGSVQGRRQRRRLRLHRDPPDRVEGRRPRRRRSAARRCSSASPSRCARMAALWSRSGARARRKRPPAASSSCARRGPNFVHGQVLQHHGVSHGDDDLALYVRPCSS